MTKGDFLGFMVDIDNTTFENYIETLIHNKGNAEYIHILLTEVPTNFYNAQNNNANDLKRATELFKISNLHYHFDWEQFKIIMSKKKLNYLSDFSYFIYKGQVSLSDYLEIVNNRTQEDSPKHYYLESEVAYVLCLTTETVEQEMQLLDIAENFFKNPEYNHGSYKFLIPNVNIFLNNLFFERILKIYSKNKEFLDIYNSLVGKKSIFKMSFVKCFDFSIINELIMMPFNVFLSKDDYNKVFRRMNQLINLLKDHTSNQTFRYLEIVKYSEYFFNNPIILNENFIETIGRDKLEKHIHSPLQNIYKLASQFVTDLEQPEYRLNLGKLELYNSLLRVEKDLEDKFDWVPE